MQRRTREMLLAVIMIITLLATDFFVLGSGIITYATQLNSVTNNSNIEFSAYFKEGENRVDSIERSIKAEDVSLYAEIKVKNEGYLKEGTVIEIENSNFNLKNEIVSSNTHINSIEGNKVNLKQINNGETVEIELGIEPAIAEKITADFLSQTSTVKMISTYVYSQSEEGQSIRTDKLVCIDYKPDETTAAELETDIITNKVLSVNGTNKKVVQLLIKSRLKNNEYPVQQSTLNVSVPQLSGSTPELSVLEINNTTKIKSTTTENGTLQITLKNEADENNQINWNKNFYDEIVVTYLYPETVDASNVEITTNTEIKAYNCENTYPETDTAIYTEKTENDELNNVIIGRTEITTQEMYKGQLYANIDAQYNTKTSIVITNANVADEIIVHEGPEAFGTAESELTANTKYIATEINLEKMLAVLGQNGSMQIKNGGTTTTINKDTTVNPNGNVVISYGKNATSKLEIKTSKPENTGIIEIKHTKTITSSYKRENIKTVTILKTNNTISVSLGKTKILENATEQGTLELKETVSKAELTIENNKKTLSTTETNELTLGITLVTDGTQYDLYKNPQISIKFPEAVENIELISEASKQNADEFTVDVGKFNATKKTMLIKLQGEQLTYPESELTQAYIQLNLKVTLSSLAISQTDKIMMAYTNENASKYEDGRTDAGIVGQAVEISAPSQLIKMFNLTSNANTSLTEPILQQIKNDEAGKTLDFEVSLINNEDTDISDVKILGKLPTTENTITGEDENTLETILKNVTAPNATIYYTENADATEDIEDTANGWTTDLSTLTNAKLYLITIDTLARGAKYTAIVTVQIPKSMTESGLSYTQYEVIYDEGTENGVKDNSRSIGLSSSLVASIKTEITAKVGQETINNGDTVKEGEVIKYTATVKNNGTQTLKDVQLKADVPEGAVLIQPIRDLLYDEINNVIIPDAYVYVQGYYEKVTDSQEIAEATSITISELKPGESAEIEYEVGLEEESTGKEISNRAIVIYDGYEIKSDELKSLITEGDVYVTVKRALPEEIKLLSGRMMEFIVYVQNVSNSTMNNLELEILSKELSVQKLELNGEMLYNGNVPDKVSISEILPDDGDTTNGTENLLTFKLYGTVGNDVKEMNLSAVVKDSSGNRYRGNNITEMSEYVDATISLTSPQNEELIKEGDTVEYNIVVKNIGNLKSTININYNLPDFLQAQTIVVDGQIQNESTNLGKYVFKEIELESGKSSQIDVIAKVNYIPEYYNGTVVTSYASVSVEDMLKNESQSVTHVLQSNSVQEKLKNVISGFAWFDSNEDGRKDSKEEVSPEIIVKLYDTSTQNYVKNEYGDVLSKKTNAKGQYTFTNIKNGSYLVVFEYDKEKYEPTKLFAEGVDTTVNSKANLKYIKVNGETPVVAAIEINDLKDNVFYMNLGLKENTGNVIPEKLPGEQTTPENPTNPEKPQQPIDTKIISGYAWLDSNENGQKDSEEKYLSGVKVRLYSISTKDCLRDENGNIIEIITDDNGKYEFSNIEKGSYIVIFEYNTEEYKLTTENSNIVAKKIKINEQEIMAGITNVINIQNNVFNINIGLREKLKFDLELDKYISRIVVQTNKETKTYDYEEKVLGKVEIHRKQIQGSFVVLEYTIKVKNNGEIAGYAKNVVDYLPSGLTFSSELNKDWYLSGDYLYTKRLENVKLNPGEEKELKLILTKTMTNENVGLINNRAEIYQDYNQYGESDIDSTPNNQAQSEDDFGTTDVIIQVATGGSITVYILLAIINMVLIYIAIRIMVRNGTIEIKTKEERR